MLSDIHCPTDRQIVDETSRLRNTRMRSIGILCVLISATTRLRCLRQLPNETSETQMDLFSKKGHMQADKQTYNQDYGYECVLLQDPNGAPSLMPGMITVVSLTICLALIASAMILVYPDCTPSFLRSSKHDYNNLQRIFKYQELPSF